jgi:hypothetical protein
MSSPTTSADRSSEKTTVSPSPSLRSGLASADHVPSACGSISVTSIFAVTSPCALILVRVPLSRAGITRVSFRISRSPGRRMPGRSKTWASRVCAPRPPEAARRIAGGGPRGDEPLGQVEIEIVELHCVWVSVSSGGGRRKISRKMPGVRIDKGFTDTLDCCAVPVRR